MPKKKSRTSVAPKAKRKRATATKGAKKRTTAKKATKKRASRVTSQMRETVTKVLAGAAAGALSAMVPPLEKAAGKGVGAKERKS